MEFSINDIKVQAKAAIDELLNAYSEGYYKLNKLEVQHSCLFLLNLS